MLRVRSVQTGLHPWKLLRFKMSTLKADGAAYKALVLVNEPIAASALIQKIVEAGFIVNTSTDPALSLAECRRNAPSLVVVEEHLATISGIRFILDLLKISWTTTAILVSDRDDEAIHEATEGLGILGHIKGYEDLESLEWLLKKFDGIVSRERETVS